MESLLEKVKFIHVRSIFISEMSKSLMVILKDEYLSKQNITDSLVRIIETAENLWK